MAECTHNCETCAEHCDQKQETMITNTNKNSHVKKVIAIVSGKGGVGKSMVTSLLASAATKSGAKAAILDADLTGPSIPKAFGIHERATADDDGLIPLTSIGGVKVMSLNLLLNEESDPVIWRGPVIAGTVGQFWTDVNWGDVDYMFIDMPPGTGDVPLTVFQSIPVDGIVIVTSPQELVSMIVEKAVKMAKLMNIPILGLVENFSYFTCPDCGKQHAIFGESHAEEVAEKFAISATARLPIQPMLASFADKGQIERFPCPELVAFFEKIQ